MVSIVLPTDEEYHNRCERFCRLVFKPNFNDDGSISTMVLIQNIAQ